MDVVEVKVTSDKLKLGMYIARLDRPWLDSPFFFQGFPLETIDQIEQVREVCSYVFVDIEKSTTLPPLTMQPEPDDEPEEPAPKPKQTKSNFYSDLATKSARRFRDWKPAGSDPDGDALTYQSRTDYTDQVDTEQELKIAKQTLDDFQSVVEQTFDALRLGGQIDADQIDRALGAVVDSMSRNPDALIWLARLGARSDYTFRHCVNMSIWSISLGRQIGLPPKDLQLLGKGSLYCDIGKAKVPAELLNRTGPLTDWEMDVVRQHVDYSLEIVEQLGDIDPAVVAMVAQHHESHDGSGYPGHLEADQIDLYGRIAALADCFDAMINTRSYRQGVPISEAIRQMYRLRGRRFQPELMEEFIHAIGLYPAGTLVELSTGQVGAVIGESRVRRLRPRIMLLLDAEKNELDHFPVIDLMQEGAGSDGDPLVIVRDLEPGAYDLDPAQYFLV